MTWRLGVMLLFTGSERKKAKMGYDMRKLDPSYTEWRVRVMCASGENEEADDRIWTAFESASAAYGEKTNGARVDSPKTAHYGARGVCCSELTDDTEAIMAAFLCGPALECPDSYVAKQTSDWFGERVKTLVDAAVALETAPSIHEYNLGLLNAPEGALAIETAALWCDTERALIDYAETKRKNTDRFELKNGMMVRTGDPNGAKLMSCFEKIGVLLEHIKPGWRRPMIDVHSGIAWTCQVVYDTTIYPLPEHDEVREGEDC